MTLREQGRFILPVGMRLCDIGTAEVPFSSVQRYAVFCPVVIGRTGSRGFIGKRMDLYWSRSGWRLEASSGLGTAQRLGG